MSIPARSDSKSTRKPPPLIVRIITWLMVLLWLAAFIWLISFSEYKALPFSLAGQIYLVIVIILAFRYWPPMARWLLAMPIPHRVVFGLIAGGMVLGHLTLRPAAYYPFTAWGIFSGIRIDDPVTCREFIATTKSGREVRLLVEQLFPSIIQVWPLSPERFSPELTDHLAGALVQAYNAKHPDDPVQQVKLMLMSVKLKADPGISLNQPSCQLLKRYDFSSGR